MAMSASEIFEKSNRIEAEMAKVFKGESFNEEELLKIIDDLSKEKLTEEYAKNIKNLLEVFTKSPNEQSRKESLIRLLALSSGNKIKLHNDLQLCSEPDWD